jgi:hypothetical protein
MHQVQVGSQFLLVRRIKEKVGLLGTKAIKSCKACVMDAWWGTGPIWGYTDGRPGPSEVIIAHVYWICTGHCHVRRLAGKKAIEHCTGGPDNGREWYNVSNLIGAGVGTGHCRIQAGFRQYSPFRHLVYGCRLTSPAVCMHLPLHGVLPGDLCWKAVAYGLRMYPSFAHSKVKLGGPLPCYGGI